MPNEVKAKLEKRKVELETEFNSLREQHSQLSKQLSEIQAKQIQLQGAFKEVEALLEIDSPKEKKENKK